MDRLHGRESLSQAGHGPHGTRWGRSLLRLRYCSQRYEPRSAALTHQAAYTTVKSPDGAATTLQCPGPKNGAALAGLCRMGDPNLVYGPVICSARATPMA